MPIGRVVRDGFGVGDCGQLTTLPAQRCHVTAFMCRSAAVGARFYNMHALKTRVTNGRVVVDEPTDLPDRAEVEVLVIGGDKLTADERLELHASLDRALDDSEAGRGVDAFGVSQKTRARRESRPAR